MYLEQNIFYLFRDTSLPGQNGADNRSAEKSADDAADYSRIRCPVCRWQPNASSRWFCGDAGFPEFYYFGCGAMWNTFATGGVCTGCAHKWRWTSCLRCAEWSPHADWYVENSV